MTIATTMKAAISESARSNDFDRRFAISASNGGITQPPSTHLIPGPALFGKDQPLTVRNASKQARFFQRVGSLGPGRHPARFLKGIHRACILVADVRRGFLFHDHILVWRLTKTCSTSDIPASIIGAGSGEPAILKGPSNSQMRGGMPYAGGRNSPTSQPTSPDFIGSEAMATCST
jgi:hypothetical protein